jgi:hypothetical protein
VTFFLTFFPTFSDFFFFLDFLECFPTLIPHEHKWLERKGREVADLYLRNQPTNNDHKDHKPWRIANTRDTQYAPHRNMFQYAELRITAYPQTLERG